MQVHIASDHAGFELKEKLKSLNSQIIWIDHGPSSSERVDYPDFADLVAKKIEEGDGNLNNSQSSEVRGVLICGSGQGMSIRANRYPHVRAALCWNQESARLSRAHNNANILCLGARLINETTAQEILTVFLNSEFEGGRHLDRVKKLGRPI